MTTTTSTPATTGSGRPYHGVGDRFRLWWDAQARPTQWLIGVPFIVFIAFLPVLRIPVLTTVGTDFGGVMAQFGMIALVAIGLNVVVGQAGLLDLGYVGFYAIGAYTVALLTSPDSPWNLTDQWLSESWAWLFCVPIAIAITALSGLILGSPTLRLRGDYLAIVTLGFGEIVRLLADNLTPLTRGGQGLTKVAYPQVGSSAEHRTGSSRQGTATRPGTPGCGGSGSPSCSSSSCCSWWETWNGLAWAGPGWRSARTRTPPRSWACRPSSSSSGRS
ncbi:hypothetical protein GCM10025864_16650 [Luteimicrobium album]|uniref:Branched-chain amino acid ABC transporter permease n=1 Tax=Luteimicrobium album TaxID=1054550 RepID=A0ABQ6HZK7_9MICO|nr:hypothetical protein [Luteimicrobium album]GMA23906.1 hypothetical protein GCM10025864_16650 [Luteimicrobium album]